MKIIQLVVEDNYIKGLGDDGKMYALVKQAASFGRHNKYWELAEGLPTLAEHAKAWLANEPASKIAERLHYFANRNNAALAKDEHIGIDTTRYTVKLGDEYVYVFVRTDSVTITGSDDSQAELRLIGDQYV